MKKRNKKNDKLPYIIAIVVLVSALVVSLLMLASVTQYGERNVFENDETIVINNENPRASQELVDAILAKKAGCAEHQGTKNIVTIIKEGKTHALAQYGCGSGGSHIVYEKVNGQWRSISPTNKFIYGIPLCSAMEKDGVDLSDVYLNCWDGEFTGEHSLPPIKYYYQKD